MVEMHLDYNALTGTIPAFPKDNSPLVYFTASYQVGPPCSPAQVAASYRKLWQHHEFDCVLHCESTELAEAGVHA